MAEQTIEAQVTLDAANASADRVVRSWNLGMGASGTDPVVPAMPDATQAPDRAPIDEILAARIAHLA